MIDAELFANVHPREFNNGNWLKPHKETFAPNLTRLAQLFNHMAGLSKCLSLLGPLVLMRVSQYPPRLFHKRTRNNEVPLFATSWKLQK